jgi:chromosome segregation ATPase
VVSNVEASPWAPPGTHAPGEAVVDLPAVTAAVMGAVEHQLDEHLRAVNARVAESQRTAADSQTGLRIDLMTRLDERADELTRAQDARAASIDEHLAALAARLDDASVLDRRLADLSDEVAAKLSATGDRIDAQLQDIARRLDEQAAALAARAAALQQGLTGVDARLAGVDAQLAGVDARLAAVEHRADELTAATERFDADAIEALKVEMNRAVGEATLVRIELDRVAATSAERFDKVTVRMGEIEALLADDMDVSAAVQLERLEELERALAELDPGQFVRRDPGHQPTHPDPSSGAA